MKKDTSGGRANERYPKFPTSWKQLEKLLKADCEPEDPLDPAFSSPALTQTNAAIHKALRDGVELFLRGDKGGHADQMQAGVWYALGAVFDFCWQNMDHRFTQHLWILTRLGTDIADLQRGNQAVYLQKRSKGGKPPTNLHLLDLRTRCIAASEWLRNCGFLPKKVDEEILRRVKGLKKANLQAWRTPAARISLEREIPGAIEERKAELRWRVSLAAFRGQDGLRAVLDDFFGSAARTLK